MSQGQNQNQSDPGVGPSPLLSLHKKDPSYLWYRKVDAARHGCVMEARVALITAFGSSVLLVWSLSSSSWQYFIDFLSKCTHECSMLSRTVHVPTSTIYSLMHTRVANISVLRSEIIPSRQTIPWNSALDAIAPALPLHDLLLITQRIH